MLILLILVVVAVALVYLLGISMARVSAEADAALERMSSLDRNVGGISPLLEEPPADEWPYDDDPPDPL